MSRRLLILSGVLLSIGLAPRVASPVTTIRVASGLSNPVFVTAAPGDTSRLFIIEQRLPSPNERTGTIRILDVETLTLRPTPFLQIHLLTLGTEQGFHGMAFHPDYPDTPYFYVAFNNGLQNVWRYRVSSDPDVADSTSGVPLVVGTQGQAIHNGGWLGFGLDGYLYASLGDAGNSSNAQSDTTRKGKVLRLDVDSASPYAIPSDNPFAGGPSPKNEFWVTGLRNPWRCSFDRATGDFLIGDVGAMAWEEIDYQPDSSAGGENYGWDKFEGYAVNNCPDPCDSAGLTRPIHVYGHGGMPFQCSITGGYVYRGSAIPEFGGLYFFGDYCARKIWTIRIVGGVATELTDRTLGLSPGGGLSIGLISSFGEDAQGELYVCDLPGGEVFKIVPGETGVDGRGAPIPNAPFVRLLTSNPGAGAFAFEIGAARAGPARLDVFDASGRLVRSLLDRAVPIGPSIFEWDTNDNRGAAVPGGVYFARLEIGENRLVQKVVVLR